MHFATHQPHHHDKHMPTPFHWEKLHGTALPQGAVFASPNYAVIKADYEGDTVIGKYNLQQHAAYIPYGGKEVPVTHHVEVLVANPGSHIQWVTAGHGTVHQGAVGPIGKDQVYVGRAMCPQPENAYTPGKVHPTHKCLYIPWGGKEDKYDNYEVCVISLQQPGFGGHQQQQQQFIQYAPQQNVYPQQFQQQPQFPQQPQFFGQGQQQAFYPSVPTGPAFHWEKLHGTHLPHGAVFASEGYAVIKADYEGDTVIGKYNIQQHTAYIPYGGQEVPVTKHVQVLVAAPGAHVQWLQVSHGIIPHGAVGPIGKDGLFVGRAVCPQPENKYTPGKIHPTHKCLYMPWGGKEQHFDNYEACVIKF